MTSALASRRGQGFRGDQYGGQPYEDFRGDAVAELHYVSLVPDAAKAAAGLDLPAWSIQSAQIPN